MQLSRKKCEKEGVNTYHSSQNRTISLSDRITYINSYTLMQGDPTLKTATMQEVSLNARYKWLNLFAAYERRDSTLLQLPYAYGNEGMIMMKRVNLKDHRLDITLRYIFNASKSKYKGTGTGQAERQRMSGNQENL